jgi:hypothetical protein
MTGPGGNTAYYAQGPYGNTVAGVTNNSGYGTTYSSTMPGGIPSSQIPSGQEDLYILKSEIVPPVCPACPTSTACPREEPCPACPACARCPEPSFECKKVPNYNAIDKQYLPQKYPNYNAIDGQSYSIDGQSSSINGQSSSINDQYMPQPVLNDFSQFGM